MGIHTHEALIRLAITELQKQGATRFYADHIPGYIQPPKIGGFIPDIVVTFNQATVLVEAESAEGLVASHTNAQLTAFYQKARSVRGTLILVVNNADAPTANELIATIAGQSSTLILWTF